MNVTHLAFFLQIVNFLNFYKTNESKLINKVISLKEKCISLIKQIVKYLNYQNPISKDELEMLKIFANKLYWPYSVLITPLTKQIIFPVCFKDINKFNSVVYFEGFKNLIILNYLIVKLNL